MSKPDFSSPLDASSQKTQLEGSILSLASSSDRNAALDQAFDYRGDVTIQTTDGKTIDGYIFDRRSDIPDPFVRIMLRDTGQRVKLPYSTIVSLAFTGKDTAAGKTWEAWVKRYLQKKAAGEKAGIDVDPLDD